GQRHHDPLLGALEKILALPQSRLAVSDLLDLLEVPALRARFGIEADQLPLLHRWVRKANIRWGLHAEHRASLDLPQAPGENSWTWGLRRMLLGYAVGAGEAWQGVEPLDEIGGLDAALLGPLVRLLDGLDLAWRTLAQPATPPEWGERLRELLKGFFLADEGRDGFTLLRLESGLQDWLDACAGAALHEALPLSVVREHWLAQLDQSSLSLPFFAGAVTFATLMPMRAIPFRRVCLLGMNDGDYPRTRVPMDFDLMGRDYRPGDRSRREDDRYLFLEALLSARDHLHISWVGRSIHDHSERPPSVLVAQLRDHVAAGWRLAGDEAPVREAGAALLAALTTEHRLQPFSRAYFTDTGDEGLFSYAREWREGLAPSPASAGEGRGEGKGLGGTQASGSTGNAPHPNPLPLMREREYGGAPLPLMREREYGGAPLSLMWERALPAFRWDAELTIALLSDFLRDPVRAFFQQRLRVHFEVADPVSEDQEPFALDALENWQLQDELIRAQLAAPAQGVPREAALAARLQRIQRRGELPAGQFANAVAAGLAAPMADLFERHDKALADWPEPADDEALDHDHPAGTPPLRVVDWLGELRRNARGERGRVLLSSTGLLKDQHYRRDKLVPYWVAHLAGHLNGEPLATVIVSKNGDVTLPPLPLAQARQHWEELLHAWQQGMHRPLPLALRTAFAWLQKGGAAGQGPDTDAGRAARACYEVHEPEHLRFAECEESPYLSRAYPGFDRLWADGEFAQWAD
ncbi:MAG TPA: exodeoxyribonuclease V subunit gamma, partial [Burkholderiaceae bacterium]|nr:exodeoxyribonuclease V subunit gamma [Burkholderiaceae bacterium]